MFNSLYRIDVILFNLHLPLNLLWTLKYFCYKPLLFSLVRIVSWLSWISLVYSIPDDVSALCLVRETIYTLVTYIQNISAVTWSDCRMVTCEHMRQCFRYVGSIATYSPCMYWYVFKWWWLYTIAILCTFVQTNELSMTAKDAFYHVTFQRGRNRHWTSFPCVLHVTFRVILDKDTCYGYHIKNKGRLW